MSVDFSGGNLNPFAQGSPGAPGGEEEDVGDLFEISLEETTGPSKSQTSAPSLQSDASVGKTDSLVRSLFSRLFGKGGSSSVGSVRGLDTQPREVTPLIPVSSSRFSPSSSSRNSWFSKMSSWSNSVAKRFRRALSSALAWVKKGSSSKKGERKPLMGVEMGAIRKASEKPIRERGYGSMGDSRRGQGGSSTTHYGAIDVEVVDLDDPDHEGSVY